MSEATDTLPFFRAQWAARLVDACVVKRDDGNPSFNESTGVYTRNFDTQYSGACLVRPLAASDADYGQELAELRAYSVFILYTETDPLPGDLVDITSATDSFLTGKQFTVKSVSGDTYNTRRQLLCEEQVNG